MDRCRERDGEEDIRPRGKHACQIDIGHVGLRTDKRTSQLSRQSGREKTKTIPMLRQVHEESGRIRGTRIRR